MTPIRVAHVVQYLAIGGLERMVQGLSLASRSHGVEPHVFAYLSDGPLRFELEAARISTRVLQGKAGLDPLRSLSLRRYLLDHEIDLVHTHHLGPFMYGFPAALSCGRPVVHTEHSHEFYDSSRRHVLGYAMHKVAKVVAVSSEIAQFHAQHFGGTCTVIENGVSPVVEAPSRALARERLGLSPDAFVIGCVARLAPEKDHETLLGAFARLRAHWPSAELVLVGDGESRVPLQRRAAELDLGSEVRFLGSRSDVASIFPAFDCVALTSVREGLPLALLEAMSHGLPVVASAVGGIPELLAGAAGLLAEPGNAEGFFQHFLALARNEQGRLQLGALAHARVLERHAMADTALKYAQIYRDLTRRTQETRRDSHAHRTAHRTGATRRSGEGRSRGVARFG